TWLSHMLDVTMFGMNPAGHHWTSLLLHTASAVLLFFLLRRMTGALWPSACVAALFAIHPTRVQSVAWVAERKDVLSAFWGLLCVWAYVSHTRRRLPAPPSSISGALAQAGGVRFLLALLFFAAGLMAKPMLVTLPLLLVLFDYWPLGRAQSVRTALYCAIEKIPFALLALASATITFIAQKKGGAVGAFTDFPLSGRIANALVSYVSYLGAAIWPAHLSIFYPYPESGAPAWQVAGAVLILIAITIFAFREASSRPYLIVGWLWYLGSLVPVIGLVQVGDQSMADRYTYLPFIGIFIAVAWGVQNMIAARRQTSPASIHTNSRIWGAIAAAVLIVLAVAARSEVGYWKDSVTVFSRALTTTKRNYVAHGNLGQAYWTLGRIDEAMEQLTQAIALRPGSEVSHNLLGGALLTKRRLAEAEAEFRAAVTLRPDYAPAQFNLGIALAEQGAGEKAIEHYRLALAADPNLYRAHVNWGMALANAGKTDEAAAHYSQALGFNPEDASAHMGMGNLLAGQGKPEEALSHFTRAIRTAPGDPLAHFNAGIIYQRLGRDQEAAAEFEATLKIKPDYAPARNMLEKLQAR
ncbi:MAG TPA: tetratricopeptide repeat protein, partial [Terriglobia bacterium]|nr:tetratricopeptide repeat protein [Terriglobia bacterium]